MSNPPKVSVIVPNFNHAPFLSQRIESILNQTYQDFELILIDDCSTDNSREILSSYREHPKVTHLIFNEKNSGSPFKQWNKGIQLARGEYIWIAESDDYADEEFLATLASFFEDEKIGLSYCQSFIVDEASIKLRSNYEWTKDVDASLWDKDFTLQGKDLLYFFLRKNIIPNASAVLFRRALIQEIGGIRTEYKLLGDWDLWIRIAQKCEIAYSSKCLNYFRTTSTSTRNHNSVLKKEKRIVEGLKILRLLEESNKIKNTEIRQEKQRIINSWTTMYSSKKSLGCLFINICFEKIKILPYIFLKLSKKIVFG